MTLLYDKFLAWFTSDWDTGIIAKPNVFNKTKQKYNPPNSIGFDDLAEPINRIVSNDDELGKAHTFFLELNGLTDVDLEKLIEATTKLVQAYSATNERWYPLGLSPLTERFGYRQKIMSCSAEITYEEASYG